MYPLLNVENMLLSRTLNFLCFVFLSFESNVVVWSDRKEIITYVRLSQLSCHHKKNNCINFLQKTLTLFRKVKTFMIAPVPLLTDDALFDVVVFEAALTLFDFCDDGWVAALALVAVVIILEQL